MSSDNAIFEVNSSVPEEWMDNNGHMHDANYIDAFNIAVAEFTPLLGMNEEYFSGPFSLFNLGLNLDYHRELFAGDPMRMTVQLIDWDDKKLHFFMELYHGEFGHLCATNERLYIHVDMETRRSAPFPPEVKEKIAGAAEKYSSDQRPAGVGRILGIRRS